MSTPPRIDELRRKFDENPRRYFAPLANEYRKAGDLGQAIGLCREFLPKQPGHMSGHIVFGQALYEAGEMAEARSVFESALALDPENLIALRHLGDIAKTSGDAAGARRWYERVLDADPRNDDIAAQLSTLASGHTPASVPAYGDTMQGGAHSFQPGVSAPGSLTPAYGIGVGMEVLPTPDSSMRAVDFDEVNARISGQTPLFTPAQSSEAAAPAAPAAAADVSAGPAGARFEPLDLDAMDSTYVAAAERSTDAVDERHERSDGMVDADAVPDPQYASDQQPVLVPLEFLDSFDAPDPPNAPDAPDAPAALDVQEAAVGDVRLHHSDDAFAETSAEHRIAGLDDALFGHDDEVGVELSSAYGAGAGGDLSHEQFDDEFDDDFNNDFDNEFDDELLAPEWPEASDIIAQIGTPRSLTPVASPSAEVAPAAPAPAYETHADETVASVTAVHVTPDAMAAFGRERDEPLSIEPVAEIGEQEQQAQEHEHAQAYEPQPAVPIFQEMHAEFAPDTATDSEEADIAVHSTDLEPEIEEWDVPATPVAEMEAAQEEENAASAEASPAFVTETMGELLVSQGFVERAVGVYEELVRRRPYDPVLTSRLAELREMMAARPPRKTPLHSAPVHSIPLQGTPSHSTPLHSTPLHSTPLHSTPLRTTPLRNTPIRNTPLRGTPLSMPPYATPASAAQFGTDERGLDALTSRELFARLAARRVPRRTPPHSSAVPDSADGLGSLFGGPATVHDDMAARALADAFAPVPAEAMARGTALDFAGESPAPAPTPASSPVVTPAHNAGFSFDRFFPDRALQQSATTPSQPNAATPAATSTITPQGTPASAPATEDLAQFSAWLKGLGKP